MMDDNILRITSFAVAVVLGWLAGNGAVYIFNRLPAKWLTDYGETPKAELLDTKVMRLNGYPWKLLFSMLLIASGIWLVEKYWRLGYGPWSVLALVIASLITLWILLLIGFADGKYGIIPDQLVVVLALTAVAYAPYKENFFDPLYGALLGGGLFLLIGAMAKMIYKKDVLGMGDVKLLTAIGLIMGIQGTMAVLILTSFASLIGFGYSVLKGKLKLIDSAPLGPYIVGAAYACLLFDIGSILL